MAPFQGLDSSACGRPACRCVPVCVLGLSACGDDSAGAASAPASRAAPAAGSSLSLTVPRPEGGIHDRFAAAITLDRPTGVVGRTRSSYTLAAKAVNPAGGCVNERERRFADRPRGARVRADLDPARGEGGPQGWCRGRYRGTATYFTGFACPSKGRCHVPAGSPTETQVVARFSFRVR